MNEELALKKEKERIWNMAFSEVDSRNCFIDLYLDGKVDEPKNKLVSDFLHESKNELLTIKRRGKILFLRKYDYEKILNLYLENKYKVKDIGTNIFFNEKDVEVNEKGNYSSGKMDYVKEKYIDQLSQNTGLEYKQIKAIAKLYEEECPYFNKCNCALSEKECSIFGSDCVRNLDYMSTINKEEEEKRRTEYEKQLEAELHDREKKLIIDVARLHWEKEIKVGRIIYRTQYEDRKKLEVQFLTKNNIKKKDKEINKITYMGTLLMNPNCEIKDIVKLIEKTHPKIKKSNTTLIRTTNYSALTGNHARKQIEFEEEKVSARYIEIAAEYKLDPKSVMNIVSRIKHKCAYSKNSQCMRMKEGSCIPYSKMCLHYAAYKNSIEEESREKNNKIVELKKQVKEQKKLENKKALKTLKNENKMQTPKASTIQKQISIKDFLIRTNVFKCMHSHHNIENIDATVCVDNNGKKQFVQISAGYCKQCNVYFIMESTYKELKRRGIILCRITDEKSYMKSSFSNGMQLAQESMLMQYGYNVSQTSGLSAQRRQKILALLIDNKALSKSEIISYLDFFINQRASQSRMKIAISKWEADREFVEHYRIGEYTQYGVNAIYRR